MQELVDTGNVMRVTSGGRGPGTARVSLPSVPSRNDDGPGSRNDDDGLVEHPRGRLPALGLGAADDPCLEGQLAAAPADSGQHGRCFYNVSGKYRGQELDLGVGGEE